MFQTYMARIQRYICQGRLLDVGCGPAHFLQHAHEQGFDVCGIEVSEDAFQGASDAFPGKIIKGTIAEADLPDGHFDVITMFNVLDHLDDPLAALRKIYGLLKPGGLILSRVPNGSIHHVFKTTLDFLRRDEKGRDQ